MTQTFSTDGDGRAAGSITALQMFVAQLIARHPDRERILTSGDNGSAGIREYQYVAESDGEAGLSHYFSEVAAGMEQTIAMVKEAVASLDGKV